MKVLAFIFLFALLFNACKNNTFTCKCDTSFIKKNKTKIDKILQKKDIYDIFKKMYSIPYLTEYKSESYRIIARHAFEKYHFIYTLIQTREGAKLIVRQYNQPEYRFAVAKIKKEYTVCLNNKIWKKIKSKIEKNCYWSNELKDLPKNTLDVGSWVLEGFDPNKKNCASSNYNLDVCFYGSSGKLGEICREIKKHAQEERLDLNYRF